jgi:pyruvate,water dikinase
MRHFLDGVLSVGWPKQLQAGEKDSVNVITTSVQEGSRVNFSETSFAILSREYMILSLRMGYHFTTIEAMCTPDVGKNYIRMQLKEGGATLERRARRIKLICDVLSRYGFEHHSKTDFLDTRWPTSRAILSANACFNWGD